jgi:AraC family transcriptional regulator
MNYIERMQCSIDFIEAHLAEEISLGDVARQAFMSLASFYRLFYGFTGYSAKEYIRLRRLNFAALRLLVTDYPTIEIALDAGFESQESFTKAFRAAVGVTPGRYRNRKNIIRYSFERMNLMNKQLFANVGKLAETYPEAKIIKHFTPGRMAACRVFSSNPEGDSYDGIVAWARKQGLVGPEKGYRLFGHDTPAYMGIGHGYEFMVTLPAGFSEDALEAAQDGVTFKTLPPADYVVFSVPFARLFDAKSRAAQFIRESDFGFAFSAYLEEHLDPVDENPAEGEMSMDLYFPISEDPSSKAPREVSLPALRVASIEVKDGQEFEQAWKAYEALIHSGAAGADCHIYTYQNGLNKMFGGPIEQWISLPEGTAVPQGMTEKRFEGGHYLCFSVQFTSADSEVARCYETFTERGYKHASNQMLIQYAHCNAPWEERTRTNLYFPIK